MRLSSAAIDVETGIITCFWSTSTKRVFDSLSLGVRFLRLYPKEIVPIKKTK